MTMMNTANRRPRWALALAVATLLALTPGSSRAQAVYPPGTPSLGAHYHATATKVLFRIRSSKAEAIHLYLYDQKTGADEKLVVPLTKSAQGDTFAADVAVDDIKAKGITGTIYYGYRAWGPNWPFDVSWTKGSQAGFKFDVDGD